MAATFVASEVGQGLRRNLSMTLAMIITTAVALGMLGAGLLVAMTASASQDKYDYLNEFRVYVDRSISLEDPDCAAECGRILQRLETTPGVASVEYKNPEQTYAEFVDLFSSTDPVLVESTSPDALGSRFTLTLTDPTRAEAVARDLAEVDGIEIVQGQGELVERVFSVLDGVRNAAFAIAVVQLLATVLLIANMTQIAASDMPGVNAAQAAIASTLSAPLTDGTGRKPNRRWAESSWMNGAVSGSWVSVIVWRTYEVWRLPSESVLVSS